MKPITSLGASTLVFVVSLMGCGESPPDATGEALYYEDPAAQRRLKGGLQSANIPFDLRSGAEGREEIWYDSRFKRQVARIQGEIFGVLPPMGRSISLGSDRNAVLIEELTRRGASFWRAEYQGQEFVAWAPESDEAADSALEMFSLSPHETQVMKDMRQAADADDADRTIRSSRSREERAPAER